MCHQLMPSLPDRDGSYYSVAAASSFFRHLLLRDFNYENVTLLGVEGRGEEEEEGGSREEKLRELPYRVIAWEIDSISIKTSLLLCSCNFVKISWLANPERRENYFVIRYFDTVLIS